VADGLKRYAEICARPLQRQSLDLNQPLDAAISRMPGDIRVTRSAFPAVQADGFLMGWLFEELFANALRARCPEGELQIHVCAGSGAPSGSYIAVIDNGTGIAEGMTERIFRPFEKQIPGPGPGMGLTICRKIIEMHGGRIWAEDRANGAEFRFSIQ
jgi:two-component system sensor histidine kinase KdpD